MFLLLTKVQGKFKIININAKIINNLSFCFENVGTAVFKERLSVPVFIMKNFHCNLLFLF